MKHYTVSFLQSQVDELHAYLLRTRPNDKESRILSDCFKILGISLSDYPIEFYYFSVGDTVYLYTDVKGLEPYRVVKKKTFGDRRCLFVENRFKFGFWVDEFDCFKR